MTAATVFRGPEMVSVLTAPEARLRGLRVEADDAAILAPERLTLMAHLPCHMCVKEDVCSIRAKLGPGSLDVVLPERVDEALTMHVTVEAECDRYVASADLFVAAGLDQRPLWRTLVEVGAWMLIGAIALGLSIQAGWVVP